ncbi:21845_t:CDS:1 [Cetraspora pellucida]|uniref:21845_t:CDS:1 n=1 Tax=Cetraspora pellucida TaxID=1433469 RepID=A0A9N8WKT5_9GLOM|nr:21845_t:CDS:1 [Cetraspora pellucida]
MPPQRTRTNASLACINCRLRHEKCERPSGKDVCTNCREHNRLCVSIPGNKRGPKPRSQNPGFAHLQPFSSINLHETTQIQHWDQLIPSIRNNSHPVSREAYMQYQLTPSIENYSYLIPGVDIQYQEQLSSETTKFQNIYINQSPLSCLPFFIYDESTPNDMPNVTLKSDSFSTNCEDTEVFRSLINYPQHLFFPTLKY